MFFGGNVPCAPLFHPCSVHAAGSVPGLGANLSVSRKYICDRVTREDKSMRCQTHPNGPWGRLTLVEGVTDSAGGASTKLPVGCELYPTCMLVIPDQQLRCEVRHHSQSGSARHLHQQQQLAAAVGAARLLRTSTQLHCCNCYISLWMAVGFCCAFMAPSLLSSTSENSNSSSSSCIPRVST